MSPRVAAASLALAAAALLAPAATPAAEGGPRPGESGSFLLQGGDVLTMAGDPVRGGSVLIADGKIAAVGRDVAAPADAVVVPCAGLTIVPAFLDAGTRVGLLDIDLVPSANDSDEGTAPSTPDIDVRDGVNASSPVFAITRSHGVATVLVQPQETNVIAGLAAVLHCTDGPDATVANRTVRAPAGLFVNLGDAAKDRWRERKTLPSTRMGTAAVVRAEFQKAREYREKWRRWRTRPTDAPAEPGADAPSPPSEDRGMESLVLALDGKIPVFFRAERLDDIRTALRLAEEFGLRPVLHRATEAWKMAEELAARKVPVVLGPVVRQPDSTEAPGARLDAAAILARAGVPFCLMTGDTHNARNLPYHAGIAASWGLPPDAALAAITRDAARILGVDDRLGTIEVGRDATLAVFEGPPLEPLSKLRRLFIRGRDVPLRSRQTELHDQWKDR